MLNWKETSPSDWKVWSVVCFLTIENNSGVEIHCRLCTTHGEENVINLRNVQWWQSVFQERRTNIYDNKCEGWPCTMLDTLFSKMIVISLLLTVTRDDSTVFTQSQQGNNSLCIATAQDTKVCTWLVSQQSWKNIKKITWEWHSTSLLSIRRMEMTRLRLVMKVGSIFTSQKENQRAWFGKRTEENMPKKFKNEWSIRQVMLIAF